MTRAQFELVGTAVGLTPNDHLNSLFVGLAKEYFGVPSGLVAIDSLVGGKLPPHLETHQAQVIFEGPHDAERWDVRHRHDDIVLQRMRYSPPKSRRDEVIEANQFWRPGERFVLLTHERAGKVQPLRPGVKFKAGDETFVAIYEGELEESIRDLTESDWEVIDEQELPEPARDEKR